MSTNTWLHGRLKLKQTLQRPQKASTVCYSVSCSKAAASTTCAVVTMDLLMLITDATEIIVQA